MDKNKDAITAFYSKVSPEYTDANATEIMDNILADDFQRILLSRSKIDHFTMIIGKSCPNP